MEDFSALINSFVSSLIGLTVVLLLFSTGLGMTFQQVTILWRKPKKLAISLLAAVVLVPIVTYAVLYAASEFIALPDTVFVGVMLLAAASGSSMAPKMAEKVGADIGDATSLMVTLAITSILSAPIVVAVTMPPSFAISGVDIAISVFKGVLLPLIIGLAIRTWWVSLADIITAPLTKISNNLMNVIIILILVKDIDVILGVGLGGLAVMFLLAVSYLLIGHLLGGPDLPDRVTLGVSTAQRNGAIAMIVAVQAMPESITVIVGFGVVALIAVVLYLGLIARKSEEEGEAAVPVSSEQLS